MFYLSGVRSLVRTHPLALIFALALVARLACVAIIVAVAPQGLNPDEGNFWSMAGDVARGDAQNLVGGRRAIYEAAPLFVRLLALVHLITGPPMWPARVLLGVIGAGVAVMTTVFARHVVRSERVALAAGVAVALWPSMVVYSVLVLKDVLVWAVLAGLAIGTARLSQAVGPRRAVVFAVWAGCLLLLGGLRAHTLVIAAWSLLPAAWFTARRFRPQAVLAAAALAVVIPALSGSGPGGAGLALAGAQNIETRQAAMGMGATTAIEHEASADTPAGLATRVAHGLPQVLLGPFPSQEVSSQAARLAKIEVLMWWLALGLTVVAGAARSLRWRPLVQPSLVALGLLLVYAIVEGSVGTAFRHRAQITWIIAVTASAGAAALWRSFRRQDDPT